MNEERALKDVTQSETTRWLLASAESDESVPGAMQRALKGLGLAPVVVAGLASKSALAAASVPSVGASVVTKWIGVGLVTSLSLLGAAELVSRVRHGAAPPPIATAPTTTATSRGVRTVPTPIDTAPRVVPEVTARRSLPKPPIASPPAEAPRPSSATFEPLPASTSNGELAALGRARRSLQQGAAAEALVQLSDFSRRYPSSGLAEEATVLRVEALLAVDRGDEAQLLGERFLRDHPSSVYASRVRNSLNIQ